MTDCQKILVIQTAFLGDAILCIPLLKVLRNKFPNAELALVCREKYGELFKMSSVVDEVFEVNKSKSQSLKAAFKRMKQFAPDLVISPHRSMRSSLWVFRLRSQQSIGFKSFLNSLIFTHVFDYNKKDHDVLRQLKLAEPLGVNPQTLSKSLLSLNIELPELQDQKFSEHFKKTFIAIAPGSQWDTKKWPITYFAEIAKKLNDEGFDLVIVGAENEFSLGEEILKVVPKAHNLCGKTSIVELAQILKKAKLLVCNDSGAMHVASSVGTPVVSIFGPTVPEQGYSPWNEKSFVVEIPLPCRPCGAHGHDQCPIGTHECMKKVMPPKVFNKAMELLS